MTTATRSENHAAAYLDAVRNELIDVRWSSRVDLLATVRERLAELPDGAVPERELGPARDYARELRDGAGLAPRNRSPWALARGMRPRTLIVAAAALVVVAALVGGLVYRAHYQPISADAMFGASTAPRIDDSLVTDTDFFGYEPGKLVVTGIAVHNSGWATATVDGVTLAGSPNGPLAVRELRATSDEQLTGRWNLIPKVGRVDVPPGKTVYVFVVMTIVEFPIGPPGDGEILDQPDLRVRVLGVHHAVTVPGNKIGILSR